jgi:hypothetical protein
MTGGASGARSGVAFQGADVFAPARDIEHRTADIGLRCLMLGIEGVRCPGERNGIKWNRGITGTRWVSTAGSPFNTAFGGISSAAPKSYAARTGSADRRQEESEPFVAAIFFRNEIVWKLGQRRNPHRREGGDGLGLVLGIEGVAGWP